MVPVTGDPRIVKKEGSQFNYAAIWKKKNHLQYRSYGDGQKKYHSKFYGSVVLAVLGVAGTMAAYFSIAAMIRILLENGDFSQCLPWCGLLLSSYLVKSVGSAWSTSMSHTATYYTLQDIRKKCWPSFPECQWEPFWILHPDSIKQPS